MKCWAANDYIRVRKPSDFQSRRLVLRWTIMIDPREKAALNACLFVCLDAVLYAVTVISWSNKNLPFGKVTCYSEKVHSCKSVRKIFLHSEQSLFRIRLFKFTAFSFRTKREKITKHKTCFWILWFLIVFEFSIFLWNNFIVNFNLKEIDYNYFKNQN